VKIPHQKGRAFLQMYIVVSQTKRWNWLI